MKKIQKMFSLLLSGAIIAGSALCCSSVAYAEADLKISRGLFSAGVGETVRLSANKAVTWRTSESSILTVDQSGSVKAVNKGTAWITARDQKGTEKSCRINVKNAPESVRISKSIISIGTGESGDLSSIIPEGSAASLRTFRTSDSSIVRMTKTNWTGEFTAVKTGTAWVTVRTYNGKEASCRVTVKKAPKSVNISKKTLTLGLGESYSLSSSVPADSASGSRSFRTSDSSIIRMTKTNWTGDFIAVKEGTAWVTVRTYNGKEASCRVTVKKAPKSVNISKKTLTLGLGESYSLSSSVPADSASGSRSFRTSDSSIIRMTKTNWTGDFIAVKEGTAWVTVRTFNGKEASCRITVKKAPKSVSINKTSIRLRVGEKASLYAVLPEGCGCASRIFRSSDNDIVKLTRSEWTGEFTAVKEGTAWVTVRTFNGKEASCRIDVSNKPVKTVVNGVTYFDGVLVVNKTYSIPSWYGNGLDPTAHSAFRKMADDAEDDGIYLYIVSGFRSYSLQDSIYHNFVSERGVAGADRVSARPGHSEHQTGLAMDINSTAFSFADTAEGHWLAKNCWKYGFIIRYPQGKESITGYAYESWHIRYVGKELAEKLFRSGKTLEEHFGITSEYQ